LALDELRVVGVAPEGTPTELASRGEAVGAPPPGTEGEAEPILVDPATVSAAKAGVPQMKAVALEERMALETSGLSVPGLRVLSVDWEEWLPGERALHIRQLLSPGDTLELRYLGLLMGTEPSRERSMVGRAQAGDPGPEMPRSPRVLEASLPPGWNQVEMRWGKGWLVARAPLPEASIRALLQTLR
jgi:hypothetical protein